MNRRDLGDLSLLLNKLMRCAPCNGGACVGSQNCEFGEDGNYGESCAIEDVLSSMYVYTENPERTTIYD